MIRFIDIRNQGTGNRFAFYNTNYDIFQKFDNEQAWTSWKEFEEAYLNNSGKTFNHYIEELKRYKDLCPEWVFDNKEDDIDKFYG